MHMPQGHDLAAIYPDEKNHQPVAPVELAHHYLYQALRAATAKAHAGFHRLQTHCGESLTLCSQ